MQEVTLAEQIKSFIGVFFLQFFFTYLGLRDGVHIPTYMHVLLYVLSYLKSVVLNE